MGGFRLSPLSPPLPPLRVESGHSACCENQDLRTSIADSPFCFSLILSTERVRGSLYTCPATVMGTTIGLTFKRYSRGPRTRNPTICLIWWNSFRSPPTIVGSGPRHVGASRTIRPRMSEHPAAWYCAYDATWPAAIVACCAGPARGQTGPAMTIAHRPSTRSGVAPDHQTRASPVRSLQTDLRPQH
jgi:hypothetical protein